MTALVALAAAAMPAPSSGAGTADPFATCRLALAERPGDYESSYCFYEATAAGRLWDIAPAALGPLLAEQPANGWLQLTLGHVYRGRNAVRAEALYRQAADTFRAARHDEGEVLAHISLRDLLFPLGRTEEAGREIELAVAVAGRSRDPLVKARAWTAQGTQLQDTGGDLGLAYSLMKQAEAVVFPGGAYRLQRTLLSALGSVAFRLGRLDEALATFEALDALAATKGELSLRANAQYNIVNTLTMKETLRPSAGALPRLVALAERALETATAAGNDVLAGRAHRQLAELIAGSGAHGRAREHAKQCGVLAAKLRRPHDAAVCAWVEAALAGTADPAGRVAAERRAEAATARANSPRTDAFSAGRRMRLRWDTAPGPGAVRDGLAALETIERLRDLQDEVTSSAELFSAWTLDYYWLAGRLFERAEDGDLALAFSITERLRARTLLEQLGGARSPAGTARPIAAAELDAIAAVQRRLLDPALAADARTRGLLELDALERQAREVRRQASVAGGRPRDGAGTVAGIDAVQASLADDQALLSFHVGLWTTYDGQFGGGSWLLVLTRRNRAFFRLPDRAELGALVPVYTGLLARDDGLDAAASARLHELLVGPALRWLPPAVTRLVVIPDGVLHDLTFDALRARGGPPLTERYETVTVPSATLWRRWQRDSSPSPTTTRALALADPAVTAAADTAALRRNAALYQGLRLGRLPFARREAGAVARYWGGADVLEGDAASERAVKTLDLRRYGILHFAAHAVADLARPERSAVLLAPGGPGEDGLLQSREIEQLDLEGRIIVLSACQSAAGVVQSGEGVLSLARAFFAAGAHAVIGSRWPIRDEDAAWFFAAFYRHLGAGGSLSGALRLARRDAIADGRPAHAWAGVVLLGSGDVRPRPSTPPSAGVPLAVLIGLPTAVLALVALGWRRASASRSRE